MNVAPTPIYGGVVYAPSYGYCDDPKCAGHYGGPCAYDLAPAYTASNYGGPSYAVSHYGGPSYLVPAFAVTHYGGLTHVAGNAIAFPTPGFWLDLSRAFAKVLGASGRYTTSTEAGLAMERATGIPFNISKGIFHAGVAGVGLLILRLINAPTVVAIGAGIALWRWFESFDERAQRQ